MELPQDILDIIWTYARPITRPDWKRLHKYKELQLLLDIKEIYNKTIEYEYGYYYSISYNIIYPRMCLLLLRPLLYNSCEVEMLEELSALL